MFKRQTVKHFYRNPEVVLEYDKKRFRGKGGGYINGIELNALLESVKNLPAGSKILELAPGTGRFSIALAKIGFDMTVLDSSEEMLDIVKSTAMAEGVKIECLCNDATELDFKDNSFDMIFAMRFLWHYKHIKPFLNEMARVLKPNGIFFADFHNKYSLRYFMNPIANIYVKNVLSSPKKVYQTVNELGILVENIEWRFILPYFIYRKMPDPMIPLLISVEKASQLIGLTDKYGSVFYLKGRKAGNGTSMHDMSQI